MTEEGDKAATLAARLESLPFSPWHRALLPVALAGIVPFTVAATPLHHLRRAARARHRDARTGARRDHRRRRPSRESLT